MSGFGGNRENIVYCLVARGNIVLAEHTSTKVSGNFPTITRVLLQRIGAEDSRQSYQYDNYYFHYMVSNGITYLCMSEDGSKRRIPFSFLEDIRAAFVNDYGERAYTAIAYAMQEDFERVLQKKMHHYNSGKAQDKVSKINEQIDTIKNTMVQNIDMVMARGEKIELLVDKSKNMKTTAFKFKRAARQRHWQEWMNNMKMKCLFFAVIVFIIFFIVWISCGFPAFQKCSGGSSGPTPAPSPAPTPSSSALNVSTLLFTTLPSSNPTTSLRG